MTDRYKSCNYSEPCAQTAISVPAIAQWHIHVPLSEHSTILGPVLREQKQPSSPVLSSYQIFLLHVLLFYAIIVVVFYFSLKQGWICSKYILKQGNHYYYCGIVLFSDDTDTGG